MYNGIELRSDKVRNIVGKTPPMLLRIGTIIISFILLSIFLVAYFVPYTNYKKVNLDIYCYPSPKIVYCPEDGYFKFLIEEFSIEEGEKIGYLKNNYDSIIIFYSDLTGKVQLNCKNESFLKKGEIIYSIIPNPIKAIYGVCYISENNAKDVKIGQQVSFSEGSLVIDGCISSIYAPVVIDNNVFCKMEVKFLNYPSDIVVNSLHTRSREGKILISKKPILRKFLN